MSKIFETISSEIVKTNPYWTYQLDKYIMPNGEIGNYHYVKSFGSVFIIPTTSDGKFLLTKQYRYLNGRDSLEFPGGGIIPDLSPLENARKELAEETDFTSNDLTLLGVFNPCNGITNEICSVYLAEKLIPIKVEKDASEDIIVVPMTAEQINKSIATNELWDGMTLAAWTLYNNVYLNK